MASGSGAVQSHHQKQQQQQQQAQSSGTCNMRAAHGLHQTDSISKVIAQYTVDARLHAAFEQSGESGKSFDYSQSARASTESVPEQQISAYLSKIQRGGHIQPFGCMIAVEPSLRIIAYSENAREMLGITPQSVPSLDFSNYIRCAMKMKNCNINSLI